MGGSKNLRGGGRLSTKAVAVGGWTFQPPCYLLMVAAGGYVAWPANSMAAVVMDVLVIGVVMPRSRLERLRKRERRVCVGGGGNDEHMTRMPASKFFFCTLISACFQNVGAHSGGVKMKQIPHCTPTSLALILPVDPAARLEPSYLFHQVAHVIDHEYIVYTSLHLLHAHHLYLSQLLSIAFNCVQLLAYRKWG